LTPLFDCIGLYLYQAVKHDGIRCSGASFNAKGTTKGVSEPFSLRIATKFTASLTLPQFTYLDVTYTEG
jgi:hypothetical protein